MLVEPLPQVKLTFVLKAPAVVGLNRTTTVWLPPGPSTNAPPEITVKGALVAAAPVTVLPPEFVAVNERSTAPPTRTDPKSWVEGVIVTLAAGGGGDGGGGAGAPEDVPEVAFAVAALTASMSAPTSLPSVPAFL